MAVLIVPFGLACLSFLIYSFLKARHTERMSIIDRGLDTTQLKLGEAGRWSVLRAGMLMIGLGAGFFIGSQVSMEYIERGIAITAFTLVLGGLTLVLNFWVEYKWRK